MARGQLTFMQSYYLGLMWFFRIFGVVFALGSVAIAASNFAVPRTEATGDLREIAIMGIVFFVVGCAIYSAATRVLRGYRRELGSHPPTNDR